MVARSDKDASKRFSRRTFMVGVCTAALYGGLFTRLGWLQIINGRQYQTLSDQNRIHVNLLTPVRGYILDRNGYMLAYNEQNFRVQIVPEQTQSMEESLEALSGIIDLRNETKDSVLKKAKRQAKFIPIEIKDNLAWEDVSAIEISLPDLPGISIDVGQKRLYPYSGDFAHIIGYVGSVNEKEMTDDPVLRLPGFQIGKNGIEKQFEQSLRGRAGTKSVEVNSSGRMVRELGEEKGVMGLPVSLSLDAQLQEKVIEILSVEKSASAVVMNVHTGAIYACACWPAFDPNLFATRLPPDIWKQWNEDPGRPLSDKAILGQYPPGSTFKMITAMAALEAGIITTDTHFYCPGHFNVGNQRFHCWKKEGHGSVNVFSALEESCDVFFYNLADDLGVNRIADMARKFGLGQAYGLELPQESKGLVPDTNWKRGMEDSTWHKGETVNTTIGQGYLLTTPLQLAVMTSRLCNGGIAVKPWFVASDGTYHSRRHQHQWSHIPGIHQENLEIVKKGMELVTNGEHGTAKGSAIRIEGMEMAGKTGTAQVKRITMAERRTGRLSQEEIEWNHRHHALFVGYAPIANPQYAVAVVVEHGGSGSGAAAPMARDILTVAQTLNPAAKPIRTKPIKGKVVTS